MTTRTLTTLIPPMNFITIKDFFYALLEAERDNQNAIALVDGYTAEQVEQWINFNVYKDTYNTIDAGELPAVLVNVDNLSFPTNYASVGKYKEEIALKVACFAVGVKSAAGGSIPAYTADQNASMRVNYLVSQACGILCASINWKKQAGNLIEVPRLQSIQRVEAPEGKNESEVVIVREITFMLRTTETFEAAPTIPLAQIYSTLQIEDGVVSPFYKFFYNL